MCLLVAAVLIATLVTDIHAHQRAQHEQRVLAAAQRAVWEKQSAVDTSGTPYLQWKSIGGAGHPATIWSEQLNASGTGFATSSPTALLAADQSWEPGVIEAPDLVFSAGRYFLFYSGNDWNSTDYAIGVATCRGPEGPCTDLTSPPILSSGPGKAGPGGELVFFDSSERPWIAFDAWVPGAVGYPNSRALYLRQLSLSGATPVVEPAA